MASKMQQTRTSEPEVALSDILGIPLDLVINNRGFRLDASGLKDIFFQDSAANPTIGGQLVRKGGRLVFHDGTMVKTLAFLGDAGGGGVGGSGAANKVAFWTDPTTLSFNDDFHWKNTTKQLILGGTQEVSSLPLGVQPGFVQLSLQGSNVNGIACELAQATPDPGDPYLLFLKARGSIAAPLPTNNGDGMGQISFNGYDGSAWGKGAYIQAVSQNLWNVAGHEATLRFFITVGVTSFAALVFEPNSTNSVAIRVGGLTKLITEGPIDSGGSGRRYLTVAN